ncbi:flagellar basal body rod C-terminal domain-containing protein [Hydrogenimonas sp.]
MISTNVASMQSHTAWMSQNAHNIANVNTEGFHADNTVMDNGPKAIIESTDKPVDLAKELPEQTVISDGFATQVSAIRTQNEMIGTLLDLKG